MHNKRYKHSQTYKEWSVTQNVCAPRTGKQKQNETKNNNKNWRGGREEKKTGIWLKQATTSIEKPEHLQLCQWSQNMEKAKWLSQKQQNKKDKWSDRVIASLEWLLLPPPPPPPFFFTTL